MDNLLKKALERRAELVEELAAVNAFIDSYKSIHERASRHRSSDGQMLLFERGKARRAQQITAMMDAAEAMVLAAGKPLTRSELLDGLLSKGFEVEGADKSKVLGTNIWRSKRFWNIKGIGYWPKNTPIPAEFEALERR